MSGFFYPLAAEEPVAPGEAWRPESAARYNAVTDLLNQFSRGGGVEFAPGSPPGLKVCGINVSEQELLPGTPVEFSSVGIAAPGAPRSPWGEVQTAADNSEFWGITATAIPVGGYGDVLLTGLVWCTPVGTPKCCVEIKTGQLVYADSGRGKVLQTTSENEALVYLPDSSTTYDGQLKVILDPDNDQNLLLIDGAYPDRGVVGHIYCNGVRHSVKRQSIPAQAGILYISCPASQEAEPQLAFDAPPEHFPNTKKSNAKAYYPLAEITMETIENPEVTTSGVFHVRQLVRYTYPELWVAGPCETDQVVK